MLGRRVKNPVNFIYKRILKIISEGKIRFEEFDKIVSDFESEFGRPPEDTEIEEAFKKLRKKLYT